MAAPTADVPLLPTTSALTDVTPVHGPSTVPSSTSTNSSVDLPGAEVEKSSPTCISHLKTEVSVSHADIPLLACCLVSGLCDSCSYNAWTCFVSMQTGNTIFLALGASNQPMDKPLGWLKSLASVTSYVIGCFLFSLTRLGTPKSRGALAASFLVQSCFIVAAAALVQMDVIPDNSTPGLQNDFDPWELFPLCLLAFQAGGQIVSSRVLGISEIPTVVLTSVYCDLVHDPKILTLSNVKRNRRFGAIVCLLVGGIAGGWLSRSEVGMAAALWIAAGIKFLISVCWLVWQEKKVVATP